MTGIPNVSRMIAFRKRLPVGSSVYHKQFGTGVTTTELTGDGYTWVKFERHGYKNLYKRTLREIHYKRLERL
jgi:hypothetical protein